MNKKDSHSAFVNLCFSCNNNCISCIMEKDNPLTQGDLPLPKILKRIDKILKWSDHIEFNGGEPTLNRGLFKILRYTQKQKKGIEIGLLSNVRMFSNMGSVLKLKKLGLQNFKVITTIYGHNPKIHDAITRTPQSFEQQIKGIKNLVSSGIKVELRVVINKINCKHLENIARFVADSFSKRDFLNIVFINMKIYGRAYYNKKIVAYKISKIIPQVEAVVKKLTEKEFKVCLFHFPRCIIPKELWKYSKGITAEKTEVCFLPKCKSCTQIKNCSGIWKSYIAIFGEEEFKPIEQ